MVQSKSKVAEDLLRRGDIFVWLNPRTKGVKVPPWLRKESHLVLQFGRDMFIPIPDLRCSAEDISGTLSFGRQPFTCKVPWSAVFAVIGNDSRGRVWQDSVPFDADISLCEEGASSKRKRPRRKKPATKTEAPIVAQSTDVKAKPITRGHLRLVQ